MEITGKIIIKDNDKLLNLLSEKLKSKYDSSYEIYFDENLRFIIFTGYDYHTERSYNVDLLWVDLSTIAKVQSRFVNGYEIKCFTDCCLDFSWKWVDESYVEKTLINFNGNYDKKFSISQKDLNEYFEYFYI